MLTRFESSHSLKLNTFGQAKKAVINLGWNFKDKKSQREFFIKQGLSSFSRELMFNGSSATPQKWLESIRKVDF